MVGEVITVRYDGLVLLKFDWGPWKVQRAAIALCYPASLSTPTLPMEPVCPARTGVYFGAKHLCFDQRLTAHGMRPRGLRQPTGPEPLALAWGMLQGLLNELEPAPAPQKQARGCVIS
jgi:hypothetical protein